MYHGNIWHFENKKRLGEFCVLHHGVCHLLSLHSGETYSDKKCPPTRLGNTTWRTADWSYSFVQFHKYFTIMRGMKFLQQCCWKLRSSGTWCRVVGLVFLHVSKENTFLIFSTREVIFLYTYRLCSFERRENPIQQHEVTSWNTRIFSSPLQ